MTAATTSTTQNEQGVQSTQGTQKMQYYRFKPWNIGRYLVWTLFAIVLIVSPLGYLLIGPLGDWSDRAAGSIF